MGFFRNIAVVDDQQLDIKEIGPQQTEAEKQFADVVKMRRLQAGFFSFSDLGNRRQDDQSAQTHIKRLNKGVTTEQGRYPVGVHAHDQVIADQAQHQRPA